MRPSANQDTRCVQQITLSNLLSFAPGTPSLELLPLNVLIGPNGSGKSNLIESLALIRATPIPPQTTVDSDVRGVLRLSGGTKEWIWKGAPRLPASVELVLAYPKGEPALRHLFSFQEDQGFSLADERVEDSASSAEKRFYYYFNYGRPVMNTVAGETREFSPGSLNLGLSILAQRRDPELYPEITYLAETYEKWRLYREWVFGRDTVFREPQRADMRSDRLEEDYLNLALFLSRIRRKAPKAKRDIVERLTDIYEGLTDFDIDTSGGSAQVFFTEGEFPIPATRLSDGSLRYLCLLAILCDPDPPPLICIEEPELGLHPDILPKLADLLVDASTRTQVIVTTHSDILVDAMSERPEAVVVFEKHTGRTEMHRLERSDLADWLKRYRLGQLWTKGQIGGTRW